ncbi:hypothetical protein ACF0H5_023677 [Mactra antiquata]
MYAKIVGISLLVVFSQHFARIIYKAGYHHVLYNHTPGPCHQIPGVDHGSEDMETLPNGMTFITSGHWWSVGSKHFHNLYKEQNRQGKILLFNFNTPEKGVIELGFEDDFDIPEFHPHGISVIQNEDTGKITLFVVNHLSDRDQIEKFQFNEKHMMLEHLFSYRDEAIILANDVAATSENSFYFSNYAYSRSHLGMLFECFLAQFPWGSVVYFDGANYIEAADGLLVPNGVLLSPDKRYLYVANGFFTSLSIFGIDDDDRLSIIQEYQLYSSPDNFLIEPKTGNLLAGTHHVLHQTGDHLNAPDVYNAPTKVLMIHMTNTSHADGITELYSDDGSNISAGTVASIYDNKMLIGSVVDKLMYCEVRTLE